MECEIIASYKDARAYRNRRRPGTPPVYNEQRVFEMPIPSLVPVVQNESIDDDEDKPELQILEMDENQIEELGSVFTTESSENDSTENEEVVLNNVVNINAAQNMNNENELEGWVNLPQKFPRPVQYTEQFMVKRENDEISGNLAFNVEKVTSFIDFFLYKVKYISFGLFSSV